MTADPKQPSAARLGPEAARALFKPKWRRPLVADSDCSHCAFDVAEAKRNRQWAGRASVATHICGECWAGVCGFHLTDHVTEHRDEYEMYGGKPGKGAPF